MARRTPEPERALAVRDCVVVPVEKRRGRAEVGGGVNAGGELLVRHGGDEGSRPRRRRPAPRRCCRRWISSASGDHGAMVATLLTVAVAAAVGGITVVNNTGAADDAEPGATTGELGHASAGRSVNASPRSAATARKCRSSNVR